LNQQKAPRPIADEECKCKNFRVIKINKEILLYKFYQVKKLPLIAKQGATFLKQS
jgi:hypothetical protein